MAADGWGCVRALALSLAFALLAGPAGAGTVYLQNGKVIEGEIVDVSDRGVTLLVKHGRSPGFIKVELAEVADVQLGSGESIYKRDVEQVLARLKRQRDAARAAAEAEHAGSGPPPSVPTTEPLIRLKFSGEHESRLHGFRLFYPKDYERHQPAPGYYVYFDPRSPEGARWRFNLTVIERYEAGFEELVSTADAELRKVPGYKELDRQRGRTGNARFHRVGGVVEVGGGSIRHEQVVIETPTRRGLVLQFFIPNGPMGPVPEIEAVLGSLEFFR